MGRWCGTFKYYRKLWGLSLRVCTQAWSCHGTVFSIKQLDMNDKLDAVVSLRALGVPPSCTVLSYWRRTTVGWEVGMAHYA